MSAEWEKQKGLMERIGAISEKNTDAKARLGESKTSHGLLIRDADESDLFVTHRQTVAGHGFRDDALHNDYATAKAAGWDRIWTENANKEVYVYHVGQSKAYKYDSVRDSFSEVKKTDRDNLPNWVPQGVKDLFLPKDVYGQKLDTK